MQPLILVFYWAQNRCIWCQFEFRDGQDKIIPSIINQTGHPSRQNTEVQSLGELVYSAEGVTFDSKHKFTGKVINDKEIKFHGFYDTAKARSATYNTIIRVACAHKHCNKLAMAQTLAPFERLKPLVFRLSQPLIMSFPVPPFSFPPPAQEEKRRANYLQAELAKNLQRDYTSPLHLPYELWLEVSAHLVHECAALTGVERVRAKIREKPDHSTIVDLSGSRAVYATFVKIDGKNYIKTLDNNPPPAVRPPGTVIIPIYRPPVEKWKRLVANKKATQPPGGGLHLFLAHDHIGIRKAFLVASTDIERFYSRHNAQDLWWRHLQLGIGGISPLLNMTSHLRDTTLNPPQKLRDVLFRPFSTNSNSSSAKAAAVDVPPTFHYSWNPLPRNPIKILDLTVNTPTRRQSASHSGIYLTSFECNAPDTTGYSALFDKENVIGIVAHKQGDDLKALRSKFQGIEKAMISSSSPSPPYWVYMPIDEGEFVTDILCRRMDYEDFTDYHRCKYSVIGLALATNRGRIIEFGTHECNWSPYRLHRVVRLADPAPGKTCHIWYNRIDAFPNRHHSQILAFEEDTVRYTMDPVDGRPNDGLPDLPPVPEPPRMLVNMSGPRKDFYDRDTPPHDIRNRHEKLKAVPAVARYTHCSLRSIREIELAFDDNLFGEKIVTGMLVSYTDGRSEAVGAFRPDRVDLSRGPLKVGKDDCLSFRYVGDARGVELSDGICRWVGDVVRHSYVPGETVISSGVADLPDGNDGEGHDGFLTVTQTGTLAWCVFGWRDRAKWLPEVETRLGRRLW